MLILQTLRRGTQHRYGISQSIRAGSADCVFRGMCMERAGIPRKTAMAIAGHKTEAIYWAMR